MKLASFELSGETKIGIMTDKDQKDHGETDEYIRFLF